MANRDALWVNPDGTSEVVTVDENGDRVPFGGKGDHDNDGKVGGAAPAKTEDPKPRKKRG